MSAFDHLKSTTHRAHTHRGTGALHAGAALLPPYAPPRPRREAQHACVSASKSCACTYDEDPFAEISHSASALFRRATYGCILTTVQRAGEAHARTQRVHRTTTRAWLRVALVDCSLSHGGYDVV